MDSAALEAQKLFSLPAKRIASSKPSAETLAFLEEAERKGLESKARRMRRNNKPFHHHHRQPEEENNSRLMSNNESFGQSDRDQEHDFGFHSLNPETNSASEVAQQLNNASIGSIGSSMMSSKKMLSQTLGVTNTPHAPPLSLKKKSSSSIIRRNHQQQYQQHLSLDALQNNEAVLRHDAKQVTVFEPPRRVKELDRELNLAAKSISKNYDGKANHLYSFQLDKMYRKMASSPEHNNQNKNINNTGEQSPTLILHATNASSFRKPNTTTTPRNRTLRRPSSSANMNNNRRHQIERTSSPGTASASTSGRNTSGHSPALDESGTRRRPSTVMSMLEKILDEHTSTSNQHPTSPLILSHQKMLLKKTASNVTFSNDSFATNTNTRPGSAISLQSRSSTASIPRSTEDDEEKQNLMSSSIASTTGTTAKNNNNTIKKSRPGSELKVFHPVPRVLGSAEKEKNERATRALNHYFNQNTTGKSLIDSPSSVTFSTSLWQGSPADQSLPSPDKPNQQHRRNSTASSSFGNSSASRRWSFLRTASLSSGAISKGITAATATRTVLTPKTGVLVGDEVFVPLRKPPLQQAAWSKHLSLHHWQHLTPRTKYLAESAALIDVSNEELERREKQERKQEKSMVRKQMTMLRRQNTLSNFKL